MSKQIQEMWDKLTVSVFKGRNHAFYGSLLCSLDVKWDDQAPCIAMVNPDLGLVFKPDQMLALPQATREFILLHELEHIARLHDLRRGDRDFDLWNQACDYEINLAQVNDGLTYEGTNPLIDTKYSGMSAEQIYDLLDQNQEDKNNASSSGSWGDGQMDMEEGSGDGGNLTQEQMTKQLNAVVRASQSAKFQGCTTSLTEAIDSILSTFLKPKVEWYKLLRRHMTDKLNKKLNWKKRNRRYHNIYIPSRTKQTNGLKKIIYYLDTSGSISDEMVQIFNSEVKYIHETFHPKETVLVQFDTSIRMEKTYKRGDRIHTMKVSGRGGTSLECVREHIKEHAPDVVVILSDLFCRPMEEIRGVDVLWVVFDNEAAQVNQGKLCHIKSV